MEAPPPTSGDEPASGRAPTPWSLAAESDADALAVGDQAAGAPPASVRLAVAGYLASHEGSALIRAAVGDAVARQLVAMRHRSVPHNAVGGDDGDAVGATSTLLGPASAADAVTVLEIARLRLLAEGLRTQRAELMRERAWCVAAAAAASARPMHFIARVARTAAVERAAHVVAAMSGAGTTASAVHAPVIARILARLQAAGIDVSAVDALAGWEENSERTAAMDAVSVLVLRPPRRLAAAVVAAAAAAAAPSAATSTGLAGRR